MSDTIKERLDGRKSAVVASLVDNTQPDEYISLSLNPDASERGIYSVVAKKKGRSETFRMRYESSMTVKKAMTEFEVYLNTDNPGQFKVIALEPTLPRATKPRATKPQTQVDIWKVQIRQYQKQRYKTTPIENEIEHLKKLINADVSKFRIGDGVGWRATRDQINRGYRIVDMDTVNKMAEIASVADTGLTITGGKSKLPNQAVPIGDLIRDKKYDSKPAFVVADPDSFGVEELPPPTRGEKARKRKRKPLPPDAISPQTLPFNSEAATCYGKRTKRGNFRVYCRIKKC